VLVSQEIVTEPENYTNAISKHNQVIWTEAMQVEINQHKDIGTWEMVDLPQDQMAIGCHWVYAVKT